MVNIDEIEKYSIEFILGHSFGAYVGAAYAMEFPTRVSHLILASPVGVPKEPDVVEPRGRGRISLGWRIARSLISFIWNRGYSPLSIVRLIGPVGPRPVTAYVTRRFFLGPAVQETPPTTPDIPSTPNTPVTNEAGLETSIALADQIDKGRLKLPKQDVAQYLVRIYSNI